MHQKTKKRKKRKRAEKVPKNEKGPEKRPKRARKAEKAEIGRKKGHFFRFFVFFRFFRFLCFATMATKRRRADGEIGRAVASKALLEYTTSLWNDGAPQGDTIVRNTDPETCVVVEHRAHSFVLKSFCVYFRVCLSGDMIEAQTNRTDLRGHGRAWRAALAFMYTQTFDVEHRDTVIECHKLADYLQAESLRDACVEWVRAYCCADDCCELLAGGIELGSDAIVDVAVECFGKAVSYEPEESAFWYSLSRLRFEHFEALLQCPVPVIAEAALLGAVTHWAQACERDAQSVRRLVSLIDLGHLPLFVLADAVLSGSSVLAPAHDAFATALARAVKGEDVVAPARSRIFSGVIFANRNDGYLELHVGNPAGKLYGVPGTSSVRPRCTYVTCAKRLFALGGLSELGDSSGFVRTVDILDLATGRTTSGPGMSRALAGFACAATTDSIFVCGGCDEDSRATHVIDVLTVHAQSPRWSCFGNMAARRSSCASAVVDGRLYVLGGIGYSGAVLSTVEVFDIATKSATVVGSTTMPLARHSHACVAVGECIYVLGGTGDDDEMSETAMVYNTRSRSWLMLPDMTFARAGHTAAAFAGHIFVCGGAGHTGACERFCTRSQTWAQIALVSPNNASLRPFAVLAV